VIAWLALACSPSADDIAKAIVSDNPVMRQDGAKIGQNYDDDVVVDALQKVITDPSEQVRLNAIESLAELEATAAGPALIERLMTDTSPAVRRAAADALGRLKVKEAVIPLVQYLATYPASDRGQLAGVWALGNIGAEGLPANEKKVALDCLVALRGATTDRWVTFQTEMALRTLK
jgi:HEAT repeat protein